MKQDLFNSPYTCESVHDRFVLPNGRHDYKHHTNVNHAYAYAQDRFDAGPTARRHSLRCRCVQSVVIQRESAVSTDSDYMFRF